MQARIREPAHADLPPALIYAAALTCGVLAAMAAQVVIGHAGIQLTGSWRPSVSAQALPWRAAGSWWLVAAPSFLVGAAVAGVLSRQPRFWRRLRLMRWVLGVAVVATLAEIGHLAAATPTAGAGTQLGASLAVLCAAAPLALFGAYFAVKR